MYQTTTGRKESVTIADFCAKTSVKACYSTNNGALIRLTKYICPKLLQDSTGLPYVKVGLLSCATKSLYRIAQNPLAEESISSDRLNPAWDRYPTPLSVVCPVSLQIHATYWGNHALMVTAHSTETIPHSTDAIPRCTEQLPQY